MSRDKVSVIVPVYNVRDYLKECIDSIVSQTYKKLEIILIDDGSTDGSSDICDKYAVEDRRIKVIHKENGGLSDARNCGLDNMTGDFVLFVDGDDAIKKDMIEVLIGLIYHSESDIAGILSQTSPYLSGEIMRDNGEKMLLHILYISSIEVWGKLFKKRLFKDIRFPKGKMFEDLYVIPSLFFKSNRAVVLHSEYYFYRQREGSIMDGLVNCISGEICDCVLYNIVNINLLSESGKISADNFNEIEQWFLLHPLWYFYNIYCVYPKKKNVEFEKRIGCFYKQTRKKYMNNPRISIKDKIKLGAISISPRMVRLYNCIVYGQKC